MEIGLKPCQEKIENATNRVSILYKSDLNLRGARMKKWLFILLAKDNYRN